MIIFKKNRTKTSRKLVRFRCWRFVACIMRCKPGCINLTKFSFHCRFTTRVKLFSFSIILYYTMKKTSTNEIMGRYLYSVWTCPLLPLCVDRLHKHAKYSGCLLLKNDTRIGNINNFHS